MRHVHHEVRADLVSDRAEPLEIQEPRVRRPPRQDHLRLALQRDPLDLVHVDPAGLAVDVVRRDVVQPARHVDPHPVGQVAAVRKLESHHRVAGVQQRVIDGDVRLRARMRLHIRVLGAEQLDRALDRQPLGDVDVLAAAVVALARIALGVLVGEHRSLALQHRHRDEVLRRDHLQRPLLALELQSQHLGDLRIDLGQRAVEEVGRADRRTHCGYEPSNGNGRQLSSRDRRAPVERLKSQTAVAATTAKSPCFPRHATASIPASSSHRSWSASGLGRSYPGVSGVAANAGSTGTTTSPITNSPSGASACPHAAEQVGLSRAVRWWTHSALATTSNGPPGADPRCDRHATRLDRRQPIARHREHLLVLVDAYQDRVEVTGQQPASRLPRAGPKLEDPPRAGPVAPAPHPGASRRPAGPPGSRRHNRRRRSGTASASASVSSRSPTAPSRSTRHSPSTS